MRTIILNRLGILIFSGFCSTLAFSQEPADINIDRDGIILKGKFYQATGSGYLPTLILLQGSPGNQWDVLGIGRALSSEGINSLTFNYSGTHMSGGSMSFPNCLDDVSAAWKFLHTPANIERFRIDTSGIILAGYSFGGGMAMTYAIRHKEIQSVISIAGNDWGEYFEDCSKDQSMKASLDANLKKAVEAGIIRFEPGKMPGEMGDDWLKSLDPAFYTMKNASLLSEKNILLFCGWDDTAISIERYVAPLYRALKKNQGQKVKIIAFQDDHSFGKSKAEISKIIRDWIKNEH